MAENEETKSIYERIYDVVRRIPKGQVATYGQIASFFNRCTPRMVGYAMAAVPFDSDVPWHRVINSRGRISVRKSGDGELRQRAMLDAEGIVFDPDGRIDFTRFGWRGFGKPKD
jgi:methylated-DNA-protein-cysteine methyltransferase-like protein